MFMILHHCSFFPCFMFVHYPHHVRDVSPFLDRLLSRGFLFFICIRFSIMLQISDIFHQGSIYELFSSFSSCSTCLMNCHGCVWIIFTHVYGLHDFSTVFMVFDRARYYTLLYMKFHAFCWCPIMFHQFYNCPLPFDGSS